MEEKIFQRLVALLGKKSSISERTLKGWSSRLAKKVGSEEDLTDDFYGDVLAELKDFEGQLNRAVAERVRLALADKPDNTEKPDGTDKPDGTGKPDGTDKPDNTEKPDGTEKQSAGGFDVERLERLERSLGAILDRERRVEFEREVRLGLEGAGVRDAFLLDYALLKGGFDYEKSVTDNVEAIRGVYDGLVSESAKRSGSPFLGGAGAGGGSMSDADLSASIERDMKKFNLNT